ncbi:MAG: hypothetical protein M1401_07700 [Chloroflexi bacterium]|nr:hypothetical protein [Chloroflexota bacterium]
MDRRRHRQSLRLSQYDYTSTGAYFITTCTYEKACLLGLIEGGRFVPNEYGVIVEEEWLRSAELRREVCLDAYQVMPNHLHAVVLLAGTAGPAPSGPTSDSVVGATGGTSAMARDSVVATGGTSAMAQDSVGATGGMSAMAQDSVGATGGTVAMAQDSVGATGGTSAMAQDSVGATGRSPLRPSGPAPRSLGALLAGYKAAVTKRVNELRGTPGRPVWQRNYYEHIVRDERELARVRDYILGNPGRWQEDEENPAFAGKVGDAHA